MKNPNESEKGTYTAGGFVSSHGELIRRVPVIGTAEPEDTPEVEYDLSTWEPDPDYKYTF